MCPIELNYLFYGDPYLTKIIVKFKNYICHQVLATDIETFSQLMTKDIMFDNVIDDKSITMGIEVVESN